MTAILNPAALPPLLTQFVITVILSFIVGLELHSYHRTNKQDIGFGTTRTFTLIGVLGFALSIVDQRLLLYMCGMFGLIALMGIYYYRRSGDHLYSLISPLIALLTYAIGPVLIHFPGWLAVLLVVTILLILGEKSEIQRFSNAFRSTEIITFSKFLIMAGVVLPLLPNRQIAPMVTVTYYQVWVALLVVSALSYLSYLAQTYLFKKKGLLLMGILGGLYSSTATTVVLGRRSTEAPSYQITQAILLATAMMYLRLWLLVLFLGHVDEAQHLLLPFLAFLATSLLGVWLASRMPMVAAARVEASPLSHPLEFRTALIFSVLFVVFSALTSIIIARYGSQGLHVLSFAVGMTDIDPFILSLLGGTYHISQAQVISAIIIASGSNNLVKAGYAMALGRNRFVMAAAAWLVLLCVASVAYVALA